MTVKRSFWQAVEVIHDVVYFAPDTKQRYEAIGLKGYWMGYVASRSAALGTPAPEVVIALFHGFAPRLIRRAIPDAWSMASRDDILATRLDLARDALAPGLADADVERLAKELTAIWTSLDYAGKGLAAAHASLPVPDDPVARLWHATSVLREYRGDCHVAILTAAGLDGSAANALAVADGRVPATQRERRGWTEEEWADAYERLRRRAWTDEFATITDSGRAARAQIEDATDRVSASSFDEEAQARTITLDGPLVAAARAVEASGAVQFPNPVGVRAP
ncbi:SCO6745 family protein [Aeromicrobium sp.]|uniref:SCO6745 family protein n=1 Tax=Aeromicrobium sp. TaxID=1871063 RepID=UPI003C37FD60